MEPRKSCLLLRNLFPARSVLVASVVRSRFNRRDSLAAYSHVNLGTVSRLVPETTHHDHHPRTGGMPSSRAACASDAPRANALNGRDLCPVRRKLLPRKHERLITML